MRKMLIYVYAAATLTAANLSFNAPHGYPVEGAEAVVVGDFNGDGKPDLAAMAQAGYMQMLIGKGDGTFSLGAKPRIPYAKAAAAGDFNGDGNLDIVIASTSHPSITVLLGDGKGGFGAPISIPAPLKGAYPAYLAVGDINGDGKLDVIVGDGYDPYVAFLGKGDGTFQPAKQTGANPDGSQVYLTDVNHDGKLDLVYVAGGGYIMTQLGKGDGTFAFPQPFIVSGAISLAVADMNGDGVPDVVVGTEYPGTYTLVVAMGNGDGTYTSSGAVTPLAGIPSYIATGDFNEDGHTDVVTNVGGLMVLLGDGAGSFTSQKVFNESASTIVTGDWNGDHHLDLALTNLTLTGIVTPLGDGHGDFQAALPATVNQLPYSMAAADIDGNGTIDLVTVIPWTSNTNPGLVTILKGNGNGTFQPPASFAIGRQPQGVAIADVNGDGIPDLLVGEDGQVAGLGVYVLLGQGGGKFQHPPVWYSTPAGPSIILTGDMNHDGVPDLIILDGANVTTLLGVGDGTFQPQQSFAAGSNPIGMVAGDFNGDGNLDVAVTDNSAGAVLILFGNGDGTLAPPVTAGTATNPFGIVAADFNGDGKLDIAAAANSGFVLFLGNGNGTFQPGVSYTAPLNGGDSLVAADFNGDGKMDLALLSPDGSSFDVWLGKGAGQLAIAAGFAAGNNSATLAYNTMLIADFNGDGKPDLALMGSPISIVLNASH